jgi:hydrogenase/urease accessory protein HupE
LTARLLLLAALVLMLPARAEAHIGIEGMDGFSAGMLHPILAPHHLMVLAALGLRSGQRGVDDMKATMAGLLAGLALGGIAGWWLALPAPPFLAAVALAVLLATAAAANAPSARLPAMLSGLATGALVNIAQIYHSTATEDGWPAITGSVLATMLLVFNTAFLASLAARPVAKIAVRVAASWLAALALLMAGLLVTGG